MKDDGTMARLPDLEVFAREHGLKIGSIVDLIHHRSRTERLIERVAERPLMTPAGAFRLVVYRDKLSDATHLALTRGPISPDVETLVRVHEPLSVIDLLDTQSDSHAWSVLEAERAIAAAGRGVIVLLHRPESADELRRRALDAGPAPAHKMDLRDYGIGAQILRDLHVGKMRLLARQRKMPSMAGFDLEVTGYEETPPARESSGERGRMPITRLEPGVRGESRRVAIVQSRFNPRIGQGLLAGALRALAEAGVADERITLVTVPGALETPLALQRLAQSGDYDALVALGAVIRGDTYHFDIVANESAGGVASVQLEYGIPIGNGILTCDTDAQAEARMDAKGYEAALAALELANLLDAIDDQ
jgi:6,7-dimethyl-8-ribityllumazine synthase